MAYSWNAGLPVSGTAIIDIPTIHYNNWWAWDEVLSDEHYGMTDTITANGVAVNASGWHRPGGTAVMCAAASAVILALTSVPTGSLALDTEQSTLYFSYQSDALESLSLSGTSHAVSRSAICVKSTSDNTVDTGSETSLAVTTPVVTGSTWNGATFDIGNSGVYAYSFTYTISGKKRQHYRVYLRYRTSSSGTSGTFAYVAGATKSNSGDSISMNGVTRFTYGRNESGGYTPDIWATLDIYNYSGDWGSMTISGTNLAPHMSIVRLY